MNWKCGKKGMKRVFVTLAILFAFVFVASSVYAESMSRFSNYQNCKTYTVVNTSAAATATAAVSTSTISPIYNRILGYSVTIYNMSSTNDGRVALYDSTSTGATTSYLFAESEADTTYRKDITVFYPYPRKLDSGLVIAQGCNTIVTVYYEDIREI
jgi:hypothetical protein